MTTKNTKIADKSAGRFHLIAAAAAIVGATPVHADLPLVPGQNDLQASTGLAIQTIWNQRTTIPTFATSLLGQACGKMVQTSNALNQVGVPGKGTGLSLGLSNAQLNEALTSIAPAQFSSQVRASTETAGMSGISGRLLALRGSHAGLRFADSGFVIDGVPVALSNLMPADTHGGGASADPSGAMSSPWGGFVNGNFNKGNRSGTGREDAYDFTDKGITAGVDYRFNDNLVIGMAASYTSNKSDFDNAAGKVDSSNKGLALYGSYSLGDLYVDGHLGFAKLDYDTTRHIFIPSLTSVAGINTNATASPSGHQLTASVGTGYDIRRDQLTMTPYARIDYLHLTVGAFTETENTNDLGYDVSGRNAVSLQTALGGRVSKVYNTDRGVITPYAGIEWNHEYKNGSQFLAAKYTFDPFHVQFLLPTDAPQRDFATLSLGASAVFPRGLSAFLNVDSVVGASHVHNTGLVVGLREEF